MNSNVPLAMLEYCKGATWTTLANMSSRLGIDMDLYSRKCLIWLYNSYPQKQENFSLGKLTEEKEN